MAGAAYREELRAVVEELIGGREGVRPGKMFGYPAFFAGRKLAVCVMDDGIGLRVPPDFASGQRVQPAIGPESGLVRQPRVIAAFRNRREWIARRLGAGVIGWRRYRSSARAGRSPLLLVQSGRLGCCLHTRAFLEGVKSCVVVV